MPRRRRAVVAEVTAAGEPVAVEAAPVVEMEPQPEPQPEPTEMAVRFIRYTTHRGRVYAPGTVATLPAGVVKGKVADGLAVAL
jgi:hypothetical protein